MTYDPQTHPSHPAGPQAMFALTATLAALAVGLLVAGTYTGGVRLLAWGLALVIVATGMGCIIAVQALMARAVTACAAITAAVVRGDLDGAVSTTATQVGSAIAEALREPERRDDGSIRLYS